MRTMAAPVPLTMPPGATIDRWRAPDGWDHRRFDWPRASGKRRGRVLLQGGRADVIEKYLGVAAHLRARGWDVTSFDWRGQGGSGRLGRDAQVLHIDRFEAQVDDLAAFWDEWATAGSPQVLIAHSMGAQFALRAMLDGRVRPAAAVLSAPLIQVRSPLGQRLGGWLAERMAARGDPSRGAWRWNTSPSAERRRLARLTVTRGAEQDARPWESDGALAPGAPSWGWIAEAFRAGTALPGDPRLAALAVPTLFLVPDHDRLVRAAATRALAARMPAARIERFGRGAGHELLREGGAMRDRAFAAIDAFLDREAT